MKWVERDAPSDAKRVRLQQLEYLIEPISQGQGIEYIEFFLGPLESHLDRAGREIERGLKSLNRDPFSILESEQLQFGFRKGVQQAEHNGFLLRAVVAVCIRYVESREVVVSDRRKDSFAFF